MDEKRKQKIDSVWKDTDVGRWIILSADGKAKEADKMFNKVAEQRPWCFEQSEKELCLSLSRELESVEEFDDYLKALDDESTALVGFIIAHDVFGAVYGFIEERK